MKIQNRLVQMSAPTTRQKIIEGKKRDNYKKQCGCSNASLNSMFMMMSTFTSMMGFACFMSNLINSIKQDTIKQAFPGSVRYQLNALIGFGIILIILGIVQLYLQSKKNSKLYLISQLLMIPFAIVIISLSVVFYDRVYHSVDHNFTQSECERRVKRIFDKDQTIFAYYDSIYNEFCSQDCPCSLNQEQLLTLTKPVSLGSNETWEQCINKSLIPNDKENNQLLEELEHRYNCAGFCEVHQYYTFRNVGNALPFQSCLFSITEEFNLIAETTIAINVICSCLMLCFSALFLLIHKKIYYIWQYKLLKYQNQQVENQKKQSKQNSPVQQQMLTLNTVSGLKQSNQEAGEGTPSKKFQALEITRQDMCDNKDECERLERIIEELKSRAQENMQSIEYSGSHQEQYELEQVLKMYENAKRNYQNSIRTFQLQQKNNSSSNQQGEVKALAEISFLNLNQPIPIIQDQVVISMPPTENVSQNASKNASFEGQNEMLSPTELKQKTFPKTDLPVIEEEQRQFDSVS